jgi:hypothetical protein
MEHGSLHPSENRRSSDSGARFIPLIMIASVLIVPFLLAALVIGPRFGSRDSVGKTQTESARGAGSLPPLPPLRPTTPQP